MGVGVLDRLGCRSLRGNDMKAAHTADKRRVRPRGMLQKSIQRHSRQPGSNVMRPGVIHTRIHASGGDTEEVARAILWRLSDEASYSTEALLNVSGGR